MFKVVNESGTMDAEIANNTNNMVPNYEKIEINLWNKKIELDYNFIVASLPQVNWQKINATAPVMKKYELSFICCSRTSSKKFN
jgi:hypothetical protein